MPKRVLPDPLTRRHLVEQELPADQALRIAEAYVEEDRPLEAIDFFARAGALERLGSLRELAIEQGDAFLLREVARALSERPTRDQWLALAERADQAGKERYAVEARRQAASGEG